MEKYRRFADSFTGINPFLPIFLNKKKKFNETLLKILVGPILVLIRLPLILLVTLCLILYHALFIHLVTIQIVIMHLVVSSFKRVVTLFNHLVSLRIILFLMGFYKFKTSFKILSREGSSKAPPPKMNSGFIVLANHTSPVDYIYMAYLQNFKKYQIYQQTLNNSKIQDVSNIRQNVLIFKRFFFTKGILINNKNHQIQEQFQTFVYFLGVVLSPLNFIQTIKAAFSLDYQIPIQGDETELAKYHDQKLKVMSLIQMSGKEQLDRLQIVKIITIQYKKTSFDESKGPLCIFFEGAKTNGNGFLQTEENLIQDIAEVQEKYRREIVVFNLKYTDKSHYSPINTTRNPWWHLILMLTNFSNELKVSAKGIHFQEQTQTGPTDLKAYKESIYSFYESSGIKKLTVTWREYQKFLEYWQQTKSKQYIDDVKRRE